VKRLVTFEITTIVLLAGMAAVGESSTGPGLATWASVSPDFLANLAAPIIAEAIPSTYEGSKDWGRTTRVTRGVRSYGNFFNFDVRRQTAQVNDGVWKKYRLTLVEPEKYRTLRIQNVKSIDSNRYALTLFVAAKVHGWARARVFESGVHVISLEAEGDTSIRLWLDAEIRIESVQASSLLPAVELKPLIVDARLKFDDFRLKRISDVRGAVAHELGDVLRDALQRELTGRELVAKLNRSLQKHPERLRLTPDRLLGKAAPKTK
jgi:hypothetical protein